MRCFPPVEPPQGTPCGWQSLTDDYTDYRGEYGIEDTRQALFEVRREGIHPFCITIDEDASEHLPHK